MDVLRALGQDANWRVRHAALMQLPAIASLMPPAEFSAAFDLDAFAIDRCALVRLDLLNVCATVAELPGYGAQWAEAAVLPSACRHAEVRSYERRAVLLEGLATLAKHLRTKALEEELLPLALSMSTDGVPNLRLLLTDALARAAPYLSAERLLGRSCRRCRHSRRTRIWTCSAALERRSRCVPATRPDTRPELGS